ncbi:MAG TPA: sigma-70 family RNA polymerase sigma factor [Polyangia bacterium]|nr:sigma-70 family RNA polymerase sigma factor [Polyangia bacterium]
MDRLDDGADDAALMAAVADRADREAFGQLFRRYAPRIKAHLVARGTPAGVADDLTQETMLLVWRKAALFDPARGGLATWLFTITRNCLLNHVRRGARSTPEPDAAGELPTTPDTEQQLMGAQANRLVAACVEQLPPDQRGIVLAAYWRGQTLRECADEARIPLGTAKTRVRLALTRLRELIHARSKE